MSLIITISQSSTRWENVENLKVLRFLLKKLWNEWECLTSVRTVLITCQKNRSYSFLDYQYFFNSYHQRKYKLRIESLNEFCQKYTFLNLKLRVVHSKAILFLKSMSERGGSDKNYSEIEFLDRLKID